MILAVRLAKGGCTNSNTQIRLNWWYQCGRNIFIPVMLVVLRWVMIRLQLTVRLATLRRPTIPQCFVATRIHAEGSHGSRPSLLTTQMATAMLPPNQAEQGDHIAGRPCRETERPDIEDIKCTRAPNFLQFCKQKGVQAMIYMADLVEWVKNEETLQLSDELPIGLLEPS